MKIAYLSTFYPFRGGISQFNALLYRTFQREHQVHAYTFKRQYPDILFPGQTQYVTETDNADVIDAERVLDTINPLSYFTTASKIKSFAPDLMLMKFWMPFFAPSLGLVSGKVRKNGTKTIAILDNVIPHERKPGDMALIRYYLKRVDGFVVMSKIVEKDLLSIKPNAKYILKPHPIYEHFGSSINKFEARQKLSIPSDKKVLLFFGFIRDYKGLDVLIQSLAVLPSDYHLVVAGEVYGNFEKYEQIISDKKLNDRVTLHVRYIDDNEVSTFFSAADVCVLPYKSATQSGIVQIAFNFNMPIIATDVGGLSEMVSHEKTGIIVPYCTPEAISQAVVGYFESGKDKMMQTNIALSRDEYTWNGFANAVIDLYNKL